MLSLLASALFLFIAFDYTRDAWLYFKKRKPWAAFLAFNLGLCSGIVSLACFYLG